MNKNILIIGAGITGLTLANKFAAAGDRVVIIEKRNHLGGNCYDSVDQHGILVHNYGPHIFHTDYEDVWQYLSQFTKWVPYEHKVLGFIDDKYVQIPFNINSLYAVFAEDKAKKYETKLLSAYGEGKKVPILELRQSEDEDVRYIAEYVFKKVFLHYTVKQWGLKPHEIDPSVTARVPIVTSRDDRYFHDKFQGIPKNGYAKMLEKMAESNNINIQYLTDYTKVKNDLKGDYIFYTGPIDEYFGYKFGRLGYRHAVVEFETLNQNSFQPTSVVNYPSKKFKYTRITEYKKLTFQEHKKTTIAREYPGENGFMSWPISSEENKLRYKKYKKDADRLQTKNIYFVGRLAEFRYYDMDDAVKVALCLYNKITKIK